MIHSEPSIIIIWTYQDMMEWMSRILVGEMAGADEDFGMGYGRMWLILFVRAPTTYPTLYDQNGPDDSFRTINYHQVPRTGPCFVSLGSTRHEKDTAAKTKRN
jgi:hypothetical protein